MYVETSEPAPSVAHDTHPTCPAGQETVRFVALFCRENTPVEALLPPVTLVFLQFGLVNDRPKQGTSPKGVSCGFGAMAAAAELLFDGYSRSVSFEDICGTSSSAKVQSTIYLVLFLVDECGSISLAFAPHVGFSFRLTVPIACHIVLQRICKVNNAAVPRLVGWR